MHRITTRARRAARVLAGSVLAAGVLVGGAGIAAGQILPPGTEPIPTPPESPCRLPENPFVDLDPASVHTDNVICAATLDLVRGGPAGLPANQFGPTLTTSRAQLASMVLNLLDDQGVFVDILAPDAFADDEGIVHEIPINKLAYLGVVGGNGESGSSFFPSREATRAEMASFMYEAWTLIVGEPLEIGPDVFTDDEGDPAEDEINALAAAQILSGKAPGVFDPNATVTREQIATFFVRLHSAATTVLNRPI